MYKTSLCLVFFLSHLGGIVGISRRNHHELQTARCTSRCLEKYLTSSKFEYGENLNVTNKDIEENCFKRTSSCYLCLRPCEKEYIGLSHCLAECKGHLECMYSCAFLADMKTAKMGYCSAPTVYEHGVRVVYWSTNSSYSLSRKRSAEYSTKCKQNCYNDFDCKSNRKCCRVGCSTMCRNAVTKKSWIPRKPKSPGISVAYQIINNVSIPQLSWSFKENERSKWDMYLVQEESAIARKVPGFSNKWVTILETTENHVPLSHLKRGHWYRYRIAAVNKNGTKGFTLPLHSSVFHLDQTPQRPPSPQLLELVDIKLKSRAKYDVLARWDIPNHDSDLPIVGFHVAWYRRLIDNNGNFGEKQLVDKRQLSVKVREHQTNPITRQASIWISKLQMYVRYELEVSSISHWDNIILESVHAANITVHYPLTAPNEKPNHMKIYPPFVSLNGTVSANITWKFLFTEAPENLVRFMVHAFTTKCYSGKRINFEAWSLSSKMFQIIYGLQYACEYEVTIQALYGSFRHQRSKISRIRFVTPPCGLQDNRLLKSSNKDEDIINCVDHSKRAFWSKIPRPYGVTTAPGTSDFRHKDATAVEVRWKVNEDKISFMDAMFLYCSDVITGRILSWAYVIKYHKMCVIQGLESPGKYDVTLTTVWSSASNHRVHKIISLED